MGSVLPVYLYPYAGTGSFLISRYGGVLTFPQASSQQKKDVAAFAEPLEDSVLVDQSLLAHLPVETPPAPEGRGEPTPEQMAFTSSGKNDSTMPRTERLARFWNAEDYHVYEEEPEEEPTIGVHAIVFDPDDTSEKEPQYQENRQKETREGNREEKQDSYAGRPARQLRAQTRILRFLELKFSERWLAESLMDEELQNKRIRRHAGGKNECTHP